jgi:hypothetical protein
MRFHVPRIGPRHRANRLALFTLVTSASVLTAIPAQAVVKGYSSSLGSYTVRLVGPFYCTGVAIARRYVATAAHCANRRMRVMGGGGSIAIAGVSHSARLDDGRHVRVSGDAVILKLASPLPFGVSAPPIGGGGGDTFTIAGYGTTDESARGAFGALHEASLVAGPGRQLVDPNRSGGISASACFGDSGGPVMRGGALVGIITRANYPRKRIACGFYTRWAPVHVSGAAVTAASYEPAAEPEPRRHKRKRYVRRAAKGDVSSGSLFANWFTPKVGPRRSLRRKQANVRLSQQEPAYPSVGHPQ